MKKLALVLVILAAAAMMAQQPAAPAPQIAATNLAPHVDAPTISDVYCSGFITTQIVPESNFVVAGWSTPHQTKFADRDYIYIQGGSYADGTLLWVVRHLRDPNRYQAFPGQHADIDAAGQPYADMGRVRVVATRNNITIAQVEFACDGINPGDLVMPYAERTIPQYRRDMPFDRFAVPNGKLQGRILMARDFDVVMGYGRKVYLSVGADQGVKIGDYFRVVRDYEVSHLDRVDALSYKASTTEDTQNDPPLLPTSHSGELPRRSLGEIIVLNVSPRSSTAMVTYSLEEMLVGDHVEMEEPPPPLPPPVENGPTITCSANPPTVRVGESSRITSEAASPDNRPLAFAFASSAGSVAGEDNTAVLDTRGTGAGPISVRCTVTDDRNLSASAMTTVNVEAPQAQEARMSECSFNRTARVDNKCKAILDDVAMQLQRDPEAKAVVIGQTGPKEGDRLAGQRAANAKTYLTRDKGIDGRRIEVRTGAGGGAKADVWVVPAGATGPQ